MSVINKMLRDLDQRQSVATPLALSQTAPAFARDTQAVGRQAQSAQPEQPVIRHSRLGFQALVLLSVGLAGAAGTWFYQRQVSMEVSVAIGPTGLVLPESRVVDAPVLQGQVAPPAAAEEASMTEHLRKPSSGPAPESAPSAVKKISPTPTPQEASAPAVPAQTAVEPQSRTEIVPVKQAVLATPSAALPLVVPPAPVLEVLAQAQVLWRTGSPEGAIALLQNALATLERGGLPALPVADNAPLAVLVRELARLEVLQGRPALVLEMLKRMEPALSGIADLWASRGNAAQRLARHAEAANAYQTALSLRPTEPRWMLGLAVSQAAQGELTQAADWAEKARQAGALGPDVAAYLRELGVPLRAL